MTTSEQKARKSCRHRGAAWLRARGLKAGSASARARRRKIAERANGLPTKTDAFIAGYVRGYRAAYKRHYDHAQATGAWAARTGR